MKNLIKAIFKIVTPVLIWAMLIMLGFMHPHTAIIVVDFTMAGIVISLVLALLVCCIIDAKNGYDRADQIRESRASKIITTKQEF